jgi:glycosyltransferase involved in cell wall biosynthesis
VIPQQPPAAPWASFCLATFRRPERLEVTLRAILTQGFSDFEVVVGDNDPERSGEAVVQRLSDPRVRYHSNPTNLGMVGNFNGALKRAIGKFVIMITDDDPVHPGMLETLHRLWTEQPHFGAYFGACEVDFQDEIIAARYGRPLGRVKWLAPRPEGAVWSIDASDFPIEYFRGQVFPYVLWSCGMVRREIALEVDGMPDYGSPFLTDFGYIALTGSRAGCCCVNTILGFQAVHSENFGRREISELVDAVRGFDCHVERRMKQRTQWPAERAAMEVMLADWVGAHFQFLWEHHRDSGQRRRVALEFVKSLRIPYLRRKMTRLALSLAAREVRGQLRWKH